MDISSLIHHLGLAARGSAEGAAALPSMLWNGPADTINWAAGTRIPRADIGPALDALGLPRPQNATERVAQDVVGALGAGGGALSLARRGAESAADPAARAMAALFAEAPVAQLASAGLSSGAAGTARENGASPTEQALIGILAGLAPVVPAAVGARGAFSSKLEPTGTGPWGPVYGNLAGDPENAVAHLLHTRTGEVPAALTHPDVPGGNIGLTYGRPPAPGSDGYGVSKLYEKHPESLADLQDFVGSMRINPERSGLNRIRLTDGDTRHGAVSMRHFEEPVSPWLITAYEKQNPARGGVSAPGGSMRIAGYSDGNLTAPPIGSPILSADGAGGQPLPRDPRQYVGLLSPEEAAARRVALAQRLQDALFGGTLGVSAGQ
ncbi:hypothetical protein [Castellaniella ginsengisoli]|uniref:Uncharacterized protein n=1 Tax=Castellaniella ginsengisoli TaxID=546114 RepID=A0AB39D7Z4_9BURK